MTIKKFKEVIEINGDNLNVHYEFNNEKTLAYTITGIYLDNGRQICITILDLVIILYKQ